MKTVKVRVPVVVGSNGRFASWIEGNGTADFELMISTLRDEDGDPEFFVVVHLEADVPLTRPAVAVPLSLKLVAEEVAPPKPKRGRPRKEPADG